MIVVSPVRPATLARLALVLVAVAMVVVLVVQANRDDPPATVTTVPVVVGS